MYKDQPIKANMIAKNASKIRKAFNDSLSGKAIAKSWDETHPAGGSVTPAMARDWAQVHIHPNKKPMELALGGLYADGYILGSRSAAELLDIKKAAKKPEPVSVGVVDWSEWEPGNPAASALVKPRGGLKSLLDSRKIQVADEVIHTKLDRIGTALAKALDEGFGADKTAQMIDSVIDDPEQSMVIARTELNRAVSMATRDRLETAGIQQVEWIFGEAGNCDICQENADASPLGIGDTFPSGDSEPPAHPNCMCVLVPYYEDLPELQDEQTDEEI